MTPAAHPLAERLPGRRSRRLPEIRARWAWPAGLAAAGAGWYASESLRHRREGAHGYELHGSAVPGRPGFLAAAEALTATPISFGNRVELLINGDQIFPCLLETIRSAQKTLCLLTYVYWKGDIAREVAHAVCERARAGVECNILLDAVGSMPMDPDLIEDMSRAGARVRKFRPPKPYAIRRINHRTHRRVCVADGRVGLTGGVGIADQWTGNAEDADHWRDTHVRIHGPVVRQLVGAFAENWLEATGEVLVGDGYLPEIEPLGDDGPMQLVRSSAKVGDTSVEALYYLAIAAARESLDITAAYFVPRPAFAHALCEAVDRGVRVRVVVPGPNTDKPPLVVAGRGSYGELVRGGVEVYEFQPTMLHAKTMTIDGIWSSVGSVNFDNRSFQLQDEATLCVQSEGFATALTAQYEHDIAASERIEPDSWEQRGAHRKALESIVRLARHEL